MSFGKRRSGRESDAPTGTPGLHTPVDPASFRAAGLDTAGISRLLVISVAGIVMLASISALLVIQPGRGEPIEVEAALIDGSQPASAAQGRVVQMCVEQAMLTATRGEDPGDDQRPRITKTCECTVEAVVSQLSPLQMQMLYVDYRTLMRVKIAEIDRTGESISKFAMPKIESREGAPVALITAASYAAHWREARGLVSQNAARCQ